jgi:hypothetical protein
MSFEPVIDKWVFGYLLACTVPSDFNGNGGVATLVNNVSTYRNDDRLDELIFSSPVEK